MAFLRTPSFTITTHELPSSVSLVFFQKLPRPIIALPSSPLSFVLHNQNRKPNSFYLTIPSSIQVQTTTQASEPEQSEIIKEGKQPEEGEQPEEEEEENEASRTRLYAQNVPWTCTADDLRPLFVKFGTVVEIELAMYNKTRNRGLAFITMSSHEEAAAALNNLESYEFEGRTLVLKWARPKKKKQDPPEPIYNLFVANLSYKARANELKEFFNASNANVVSADIIFHDNPRRSSGYGFVSFNTKEEAEAALSAFQGKEFMGRPLRVSKSRRSQKQDREVQSEGSLSELNNNAEEMEKKAKV